MAPLAQTLALLAMAVATVAMDVVTLDMAKNSFDDQYLNCGVDMTEKFRELQCSDFLNNDNFAKNWTKAIAEWKEQKTPTSPLTPEQAIALMAYTMSETNLYETFNAAVREGGSSSRKYRDEFHFKSLHFLLTQALQTLRQPNNCRFVFWGVKGVQFKVKEGDQVRFGQFVSTSLSGILAQYFGRDTTFKVYTCHGVDIHEFSKYPWQKEVLIPPFETFNITAVSKEGNTTHIKLRSSGNSSNYNCEWLKGGTLPRTSPHHWELLLATMAMAAVSGTL